MISTYPDPLKPVPALERVWKDNAAVVDRLGLRYLLNGLSTIGTSWYVPLRLTKPSLDAYELRKTIDELQRQVETSSGLDVTLALTIEDSE